MLVTTDCRFVSDITKHLIIDWTSCKIPYLKIREDEITVYLIKSLTGFVLQTTVTSISYLASDPLSQSSDYSMDFSPTYRVIEVSFVLWVAS